MSMQPRPWPDVPELTARMARSSSRQGNLAMRIRDELGEVYADARFAGAFGVRGRPGISPGQLMMASVLQFSENLTGRQAAEAVRDRMTWKYALGLELEDPGFDASVLSEFRSRLVAGDLVCLALDALLERLAGLGLVKAGGRQRTDSTCVLGAIRALNRLELAGETLRAALEALAVAAPGWLAGVIGPSWQQVYGARIDDLHLPESPAGMPTAGLGDRSRVGGTFGRWRCVPKRRRRPRQGRPRDPHAPSRSPSLAKDAVPLCQSQTPEVPEQLIPADLRERPQLLVLLPGEHLLRHPATSATPEQTRQNVAEMISPPDGGPHITAAQVHIRWIFRQDYRHPVWGRWDGGRGGGRRF